MRPAAEVGTNFMSLGQLAQVSIAGRDLLTLDPGQHTVFAEAVEGPGDDDSVWSGPNR